MSFEHIKSGLELRDCTWSEWRDIGMHLGELVRSSPWYMADWLVYGELKFGEKVYQVADKQLTGLSPERLRSLAWVANQFPVDRRHHALSFEAHRELASIIDPKDRFKAAAFAVENEMGSKEIRKFKKQMREEDEAFTLGG